MQRGACCESGRPFERRFAALQRRGRARACLLLSPDALRAPPPRYARSRRFAARAPSAAPPPRTETWRESEAARAGACVLQRTGRSKFPSLRKIIRNMQYFEFGIGSGFRLRRFAHFDCSGIELTRFPGGDEVAARVFCIKV